MGGRRGNNDTGHCTVGEVEICRGTFHHAVGRPLRLVLLSAILFQSAWKLVRGDNMTDW